MGSMDKVMQNGKLLLVAAEEDRERKLSSKKKQLMSDSINMLNKERKKHSKLSSKNSSKNTILINNTRKLNLGSDFMAEETKYRSNERIYDSRKLMGNYASHKTPERQK